MLTVRSGTRITIHSLRRADLAVSAIETNAPSSSGGVYLTILFTRPPRSLNRVSTRSPLTSADRPILVAEGVYAFTRRTIFGLYSCCCSGALQTFENESSPRTRRNRFQHQVRDAWANTHINLVAPPSWSPSRISSNKSRRISAG